MRDKKFYQEVLTFILPCLFIFSCFILLFIFRDFTPNNELKYLSIADEAIPTDVFLHFGTTEADMRINLRYTCGL